MKKLLAYRHFTEVALVVTSALLVVLNLLIWDLFTTLWIRIPAVIATFIVMLAVLEFCPLRSYLRRSNLLVYPWTSGSLALLITFIYLAYPSVWGILGCTVGMVLMWMSGMFSIASVGCDMS